ncbi:hypothetical protein ACLOJK_008179 [Asimina triloba]
MWASALVPRACSLEGQQRRLSYGISVDEFTNGISELRNRLGGAGMKDKGITLPPIKGTGMRLPGSLLAGDILHLFS